MIEQRQSITVEEAVKRVMERVRIGEIEKVQLHDALGRYVGEEIFADHDVPLFDRSMVDGFAIRAENSSDSEDTILEIIEEIGAGTVAQKQVKDGQAVRIMTGAPLPVGTNAVAMIEHVREYEYEGKKYIELKRKYECDEQIGHRGEDMKAGTLLIKPGKRLGAGDIALLATFGYAEVAVYKQPIVAIIATGSELIEIDEQLTPGKIRNSNSSMLYAQLLQVGAIPKYYGILADDFEQSYEAIKNALQEVDYVMTTGGVSVGDFDFIPEILAKLDADVLFNKVEMRPGSVTTVATKGEKWIFGLSGNPSACYVGFELFARPLLKTWMGSKEPHLKTITAKLATDLGNRNEFARFVRGEIFKRGYENFVKPIGLERSGIVSSLAEANGLIYVPAKIENISKGESVQVYCLPVVK